MSLMRPRTDNATVTIGWARCEGHGVCVAAFREQLEADRWGYPQGIPTSGVHVDPDEIGAAKVAVATCPAAALRLALR